MTNISESIIINSPIEKVRSIFQNFNDYAKWTSFIQSIEVTTPEKDQDTVAADDTLKVVVILPKSNKKSIFTPTVLQNDKNCFKWRGVLMSEYIFCGEHSFNFELLEDGKTKIMQSEKFSGLLSRPLMMMIGADTTEGFKLFNDALKKQCEN